MRARVKSKREKGWGEAHTYGGFTTKRCAPRCAPHWQNCVCPSNLRGRAPRDAAAIYILSTLHTRFDIFRLVVFAGRQAGRLGGWLTPYIAPLPAALKPRIVRRGNWTATAIRVRSPSICVCVCMRACDERPASHVPASFDEIEWVVVSFRRLRRLFRLSHDK